MVFRKFQSISLILILVLNVIIIFNPSLNLPTVQAFPPPDNEGLTNYGGNWDVTGYSYRGNQTIILNGNLTISSGGKLVLRNVTFMLNPDVNGTFHIRVRAGGQLFIYDDTKISTTFLDGNRRTKLWLENNAKFHAENSLIEHCVPVDFIRRPRMFTSIISFFEIVLTDLL